MTLSERMKREVKRLGLKKGARVYDRWDRYDQGVVLEVLKTKVRIQFKQNGLQQYDIEHLQFLEPWSP